MTSVPALVISSRDNVATALQPLEAGQVLVIGGQSITIRESTPKGHKIALRLIRAGEQVMKYGSTIGTATCDIGPGAHVHTHNVASGRGRGDLGHGRTQDVEPDSHGRTRNNTDQDGHGRTRNNTDQDGPRQSTEEHGAALDDEISASESRIAEPPDFSPVTGKPVQ